MPAVDPEEPDPMPSHDIIVAGASAGGVDARNRRGQTFPYLIILTLLVG